MAEDYDFRLLCRPLRVESAGVIVTALRLESSARAEGAAIRFASMERRAIQSGPPSFCGGEVERLMAAADDWWRLLLSLATLSSSHTGRAEWIESQRRRPSTLLTMLEEASASEPWRAGL